MEREFLFDMVMLCYVENFESGIVFIEEYYEVIIFEELVEVFLVKMGWVFKCIVISRCLNEK